MIQPPGKVKKTGSENNKVTNSVQFSTGREKKRSVRKTLIIVSSGIITFVVITFVVFTIFLNDSSFRPVLLIKKLGKSFIHQKGENSTVMDIDGNVYKTVTIGTQVWMAEDLKTTHYNDGTPIPYVTDDKEWENMKSGAYCWAENDESNKNIYGALYNWYATTGKLCPVGWHVSTNSDWKTLEEYCGGWEIAGAKLKESGTIHWKSPNYGATNEFKFTALPAGGRGKKVFPSGEYLGYWCPPRCGDFRSLCNARSWIYFTGWSVPYEGWCIRCVKDK